MTAAPRFGAFTDGSVTAPDLGAGFWSADPYVGTRETWTYPDLRLVLERYLITTDTGTRELWNWMHCLTPEEVGAELAAAGLVLEELLGDVAGAPYDPASETFAVIARAAC